MPWPWAREPAGRPSLWPPSVCQGMVGGIGTGKPPCRASCGLIVGQRADKDAGPHIPGLAGVTADRSRARPRAWTSTAASCDPAHIASVRSWYRGDRELNWDCSKIRNNFSVRTLLCSLWLWTDVIEGKEGCAWLPFSGRVRSHVMTGWTAQRCRILNCYAIWLSSSKSLVGRVLVRPLPRSACRFLPYRAELPCSNRRSGCDFWIEPPASWR